MALEIVISANIHDLFVCMESNSALTVPLPPPLSKLPPSTAKLGAGDSDSMDSGHEDEFMLFGQDAFPGLILSDSEFSEEFSDMSAASSRRGSDMIMIPNAPPPPQLPSYLRDICISHSSALTSTSTSQLSGFNAGLVRTYDDEDLHTCIVCYDEKPLFNGGRKCCSAHVCQVCMIAIAQININEGTVFIQCPNLKCKNGVLEREEILSLVDGKTRETFIRLRLEAEGDVTQKACPNCSLITKHTLPKRYRKYRVENVRITCTQCQHVWCFSCHSPWHKDLTCKQHKKGSVQFKQWSKKRSAGIANCQKCPLCQVYIQRTTGCDYMTCNRCDSHFCYKCGGLFLEFPGLGDHYRKTGILGCKRYYNADKPTKRLAVRGSYFGAKVAALTGYPILFLAGAVVVVAVGAVALPVYGGYRYYKYKKNLKRRYGRRRRN